jgi:hypothetical protein
MEVLEDQLSMPQSVGDGEPFREQLKRLRHKRLHRPRMLFSSSVSSRTGEGLKELRRALTALMENQRLFPQVGAKVPLNYSMLERLAQEGRTQASGGTETDSQTEGGVVGASTGGALGVALAFSPLGAAGKTATQVKGIKPFVKCAQCLWTHRS